MQGAKGVVALAVIAAYICLIDRVAISVAIIPMVDAFGWSPAEQGNILSAFFIGYVVLQLPAGWLSDRFGGKWVLGLGVVFWSVFTLITPWAAAVGLGVLLVSRFLMGVAESVTWPAIYNLFGYWVPESHRGTAIGLLNSAISGGTIIALALTPWLIGQFDWRAAFWCYGLLGLAWAIVWFILVPQARGSEERLSKPPATVSSQGFSLRKAVVSKPVMAMMAAHFCTNWVVFLSLAWLPSFLSQAHGIPLSEVGLLVVMPFLVSTMATPLAGRLGDQLIAGGWSRLAVRRSMQTAALLGIAAVFFMVGYVDDIALVIGLFCIGNLFASGAVAGFGANPMDLAPQHAATLYGASNALASLGSGGAVFVAGQILEHTGSWSLVFQSAAIVGIVGALIYLRWSGVERQF